MSPSFIIFLGIVGAIAFLVYDQMRQPSAAVTATPTTSVIATEAPVSRVTAAPSRTPLATNLPQQADIVDASLFIPKAGIYAPIIRVYLDGTSWDVSQLGMKVGHLQGTSWIDSGPGNIVLSGHVEMADGRAGVFAHIDELKVGDLIIIEQGDEARYYSVVSEHTVEPDDLTPIYPSTDDRITLITCGSYNFFQDSYLERVVVVAERIS